MTDNLFKDLYKDIVLREKYRDPRKVASNYLNLDIWKLHDNFYKVMGNPNYKRVVVIAPREHGKALSLDSDILTPTGWVKLSDLKEGDKVINGNGIPVKVYKLHPIEKMDLYRLQTRDGKSVLCTSEHLWIVKTPSNTGNRPVIRKTSELILNYKTERFEKRNGKKYVEYRHFIPSVKPVQFKDKKLELDPYILGVWLGDGSSYKAEITTMDNFIIDEIRHSGFKTSYEYKRGKATTYGILKMLSILKSLDLIKNKHIPETYLYSSIKQRTALLQGLIDTDGNVSYDGQRIEFTTKFIVLKNNFVSLVRSLGGTVTVYIKTVSINNKKLKYYTMNAWFPSKIIPVRLPRKIKIWKGKEKYNAIIDIHYEKTDYGRCITVEGDGSFITSDYLMTHNSEIFAHVLPIWSYLNNHNIRVLIASKSRDQAVKSLSLIKQDFEKNKKIIDDFGDLKATPWQDDKIYLKRDATVSLKDPTIEAIGIGGHITGAHFDIIILDDVIDDENVKTEKRRTGVYDWLKRTVEPLLHQDGKIYIIGTRKHFRDLYQQVLNNPIWYHMNCQFDIYDDHKRCGFKAILKEPGKYTELLDDTGTIIGLDVEGDSEILSPEAWTIEKLLMKKFSMGTPAFESEMQNNPSVLEGLLFDEDWIQTYETAAEVENITMRMKVMAFDLAVSEKDIEGGDYFAGVVVGLSHSNKFYVIDIIREHLDFPSQVRRIQLWYDFHRPDIVIIETNAYQKALAQHLQNISTLPIVQRDAVKDKYTRLLNISPYFESRRVYIRKDMDEFKTEYKEFPRGEHEDILDALQMAITEIVSRSTEYAILGWGPSWRRKIHDDRPLMNTKEIPKKQENPQKEQ